MATQIRLVISPEQITEVVNALANSPELTPPAMHFLNYLKKKQLEVSLGITKASYIKKSSAESAPINTENVARLISPDNVMQYTMRISQGEVIQLSQVDKEEIKSFASIMGITLPATF